MQALENLSVQIKDRQADLIKAKEEGRKIVGYTPGGYLPEELVIASGAIPLGLIRGGEHEPVEAASAYLPRWLDTFCRAQVGYKILKEDPLYDLVDLLVVPVTDNNIRAIPECWGFFTDTEIFQFGVPHAKTDHAFDYYLEGLHLLAKKLESLTDMRIEEQGLKESINLLNRERVLLRELSLMRRSERLPIGFKDFLALNHASFILDKVTMVDILESVVAEAHEQDPPPFEGPRILLTGSTLAMGDDKIVKLIEEAGASIVVEEFAEGVRHYWEDVTPNGDLVRSLADRYFRRRVPPAWFRPGKERHEFLIKLAGDFKVDGVIWYQMMYRDSYDIESYYFPDILQRETGLTMLKIESDYDAAEIGPMRTRVETFVEGLKVSKNTGGDHV